MGFPLRTFWLHWPDGSMESIKGYDLTDAFARNKYTVPMYDSLIYWEEI